MSIFYVRSSHCPRASNKAHEGKHHHKERLCGTEMIHIIRFQSTSDSMSTTSQKGKIERTNVEFERLEKEQNGNGKRENKRAG